MILALDLSKYRTGWAYWDGTSEKARFGHWKLGSEYTTEGDTYIKLQKCLMDHHRLMRIEHCYLEQPINPANLSGHTNIDTLRILSGLAAHVQSFGRAVGFRSILEINVSSWRRDFIGPQKRGTKRQTLKTLCMERCRQLGFAPRYDDEADAIGLLTYAILLRGITPPWLSNEVLRPMFAGAKA